MQQRTTPNQWLTFLDEKTNGYDLDSMGNCRLNFLSVLRGRVKFIDPEHTGDIRSIYIRIHQADIGALLS